MIHLTSRAIFLNDKGQILVQKDKESDYVGLPGGGIKSSETPMDGLLREIEEEMSIKLVPDNFELVGVEYRNDKESGEVIFIFKGCELSNQELERIVPANEISLVKFIDLSEAYKILTPTMSKRLSMVLSNTSKKVVFLENGKEV
jgi:8-oxo-dGTP pyrophosphatase MutT (NUDIX family)